MTITVAAFPDLLDVDVPAGNERYVIPSASVALTDKQDWFGHFRETIPSLSFNPVDPLTFNAGLTAGYQTVNVGGAKTLASATGLTNDATVYTADVLVDGGTTYALSIVGSTAQTYAALLARINSQLKDEAKAEIVSGNIRITSPTKGGSSSIAITDTDLFSTLTGFVSVVAAVAGVTPFRGMTFNKSDAGVNSLLVVGHKTSLDAQLSASAEVTPVTMRADVASDLNNKHWLLNSTSTGYYVWYNVAAAGVDPAVAGRTGIEVAVAADAADTVVATATAAAINALADFVCPAPGAAIITVTNAVSGVAVDAADGDVGGAFAVGSITQGAGLAGAYIPA